MKLNVFQKIPNHLLKRHVLVKKLFTFSVSSQKWFTKINNIATIKRGDQMIKSVENENVSFLGI